MESEPFSLGKLGDQVQVLILAIKKMARKGFTENHGRNLAELLDELNSKGVASQLGFLANDASTFERFRGKNAKCDSAFNTGCLTND
jgi:hypothetical protein